MHSVEIRLSSSRSRAALSRLKHSHHLCADPRGSTSPQNRCSFAGLSFHQFQATRRGWLPCFRGRSAPLELRKPDPRSSRSPSFVSGGGTSLTSEQTFVNEPPWEPQQVHGSGLLHRRNRHFDPQSGRSTQPDPIGLAGGLNLYGYAGGDPINARDPFGFCPEEMRTEERKQECREYNEHRIRRALAIVDEEIARGNAYAVGSGEEHIDWAHDVDLQRNCPAKPGESVVACAFPGSGTIYVDPDRDPAAIAASIVHERIHLLFRAARGGEGCARWQAWLFLTQMNPASQGQAFASVRPPSMFAPRTDSQVPCR
jgi:RHS repeat-associated protein